MIELEDRIRRYAEATADPAAIGPDPADTNEAPTSSARSGRMVLVACLVALVAVAGGLLAVVGRDDTPTSSADHSATATQDGEQISVSLTVDDTEVPFGGAITAHATLTNTSTEPLTLITPAGFVLSVNWGATLDDTKRPAPTTLERIAALYNSAPFQPASGTADMPRDTFDPRARLTLAPGESVTIDGTYVIDDLARTGPVRVTMTPSAVKVIDGREAVSPLAGTAVSVPVTVGASPAGTITEADAIAVALADPRIAAWGAAIDANGGMVGAGAGSVQQTADGWRLLNGLTDGNASGDLATELRDFGGPGLIARVDADQNVTIEWIAGP